MNQHDEKDGIQEATEDLDFNKPNYVFNPPGNHTYRQMGYYLVCKSCELSHAIWIGADRIMVGVDNEGRPVLKKRSEIGMR